MAEAVVENPLLTRFFCHECNSEVDNLLPNYTCPMCTGGFIEELENGGNNNSSNMDLGSEDADIDVNITGMSLPEFLDDQDQDELQSVGLSLITNQGPISTGSRAFRPRPYETRSSGESRASGIHGSRYHHSNLSRNHGRQQDTPMTIDNLLHDFIFNLSGVGFGVPSQQGAAIPPIFNLRLLIGNPGDYVWGREGLDAIVTQLLNQMDCTGPPPLPKKQIDEIPTTEVSQSQVDSKLQCSVCWEDFKLSEPVRQLPCQHVYHEPCIVPWLELHGTCPICRQSLGEQNTAEANQDTVGPSLAALFRAANESNTSRSPSTSSTDSNVRNDSSNEI